MSTSFLSELKSLKSQNPLNKTPERTALFAPATLEVSLIIPARKSADTLMATVQEAHEFLASRYGHSFEIILVPNPAPGDRSDPTVTAAENLARRYSQVHSQPHFSPPELPGKGAAIRTGLQSARGKWIFFTDADLPYDLEFFDGAMENLRTGLDLVTGNRRLPSSHFYIPVRLLKIAYGRHRLGLWYNRLVRILLPIYTTDTQAGIKALSRRLAQEFSLRQACPGFLFDLEIFLTAHGQGYGIDESPVALHLNSEKSTVRVLRESILVGFWLTRITWRNWMKVYGNFKSSQQNNRKILTRYGGASLSTRLFLSARWRLTPYSRMAARLPLTGRILDLGCGHGLFALAIALNSPSREVLGIDHDLARITLASTAVQDLPNIRLQNGNMTQPPEEKLPYSGIAMIDVMHYFDLQTQEALLKKAYQMLEKGGTLIVREVDPEGGIAAKWNRLYEKLATRIGFTQTEKQEHHFRSQKGWKELMENTGFKVRSERCSSLFFADILYTCERQN